jgi:TPR repeat protein
MRILTIFLLLICVGCSDDPAKEAETAFANKDYVKAFKLYSALAETGNAKAQTQLGFLYELGWGTVRDAEKAIEWYSKAAEQGQVHAQHNLGLLYKQSTQSSPPNYPEAVRWLEICVKNHKTCYSDLGEMYELGLGVQENQSEAVRLYKLGIDEEINFPAVVVYKAQSAINLARMYANGWGVQQDCEEALKLMKLAAKSDTLHSVAANKMIAESSCPGESAGRGHRW